MKVTTCILLLISLLLSPVLVSAQVPRLISYQGTLTDSEGKLQAGSYTMRFSLYNTASDGNALWNETQLVPVFDGIFNVFLGSVNPLTISFDKQYWLGITVGSTELLPRIQLASSAYSLTARSVEDGAITTAKLADAAVTTTKLADNAVTSAKISNATITGSDIAASAIGTTQLADGSVTTAKLADAAVTTAKLASGAVTLEVVLGTAVAVTVPASRSTAVTPTCPAGYRAISGGWARNGGSRQLFVTASVPPQQQNPTGWELNFWTTEAGGATVDAWAVCARVTP